jgi:DNA-binding LytR/AlgR family response regulator
LYIIVERERGGAVKVEIKIDGNFKEPKVVIYTDKITDEINALVGKISEENSFDLIAGFKDEKVKLLELKNIFRIYTESGKVFANTSSGNYALRLRLYEIEERLENTSFVRISNSEIINLKKVKDFDMSFTGTICVTLLNGDITYVSRRNVSKIKEKLGI